VWSSWIPRFPENWFSVNKSGFDQVNIAPLQLGEEVVHLAAAFGAREATIF
jgi:hypothetical protein